MGADGAQSTPLVIELTTHDAGTVVSGHSELSSGVAVIVSFSATKDGEHTTANCGDLITLTAIVSESTDSCTINGSDAALSDTPDGHKQATATVTLTESMSGDFDCQVTAEAPPVILAASM